jgi:hypothetical protein
MVQRIKDRFGVYRALAKNSSFGFFSDGFRVGKNQMCGLCGWVFFYAAQR